MSEISDIWENEIRPIIRYFEGCCNDAKELDHTIKIKNRFEALINQAQSEDSADGCLFCDSGETFPSRYKYCPYCGAKLYR